MEASKKGFLKSDFEIFYLNDCKSFEFDFHFHDFHKLIIFFNGKVNYVIEGKGYKLRPFDVLLVRNNEIHKPEIDSSVPYERIVIWMKHGKVLEESENEDLLECFKERNDRMINLLRLGEKAPDDIRYVLDEIKRTIMQKGYASNSLKKLMAMQLMIYISRELKKHSLEQASLNHADFDRTMAGIIDHINTNLTKALRIDEISENFYISKYHLMRKFKKCTGYTIHQYILKKRLIRAKDMIKKGKLAAAVSFEVGFGDYSSFVRAYKKMFNELPSGRKKA